MSTIHTFFEKHGPIAVVLAIVVSVFFVVAAVEAASTISTNISTGGTLSVTGASSLSDTVIDGEATTTSLVINGGQQITAHYSGGYSDLDFGEISTSTCSQKSIEIVGVAVGDTVFTGAPSTIEDGLIWSAFASDLDEVTVRLCNISGDDPTDPAEGQWRFDIWRHTNSLPTEPEPAP